MKWALCLLTLITFANAALSQKPRGHGALGKQSAARSNAVQLYPKFAPGQILYYQLDFRTRMNGATTSMIADPQAPKQIDISVGALIRLEVLALTTSGTSPTSRPAVRVRTTYTKVAATAAADVPDPQVETLRDRIQKLDQQSLEFTIDPDGKVANVSGLEAVFPEQIEAVHDWIVQVGVAALLPREGIRIGQKWESALPLTGATPLTGVTSRQESTYVRNEPCHAEKQPTRDKSGKVIQAEECAVILSTFTSDETKKGDRTPEEFRKRNLRTAGVVSGKGESLTYISLETGQVVSVTQNSGQVMDVTISSVSAGSSLRYSGRVETQSQLSLVDAALVPAK